MIDPKVIEADARANIEDWPAKVRHRGRVITVSANAAMDSLNVVGGALLDDMVITCVAIAADFGKRKPRTHDDMDLMMSDGSWLALEVNETPDYYDPISPTIQFTLGSTAK